LFKILFKDFTSISFEVLLSIYGLKVFPF